MNRRQFLKSLALISAVPIVGLPKLPAVEGVASDAVRDFRLMAALARDSSMQVSFAEPSRHLVRLDGNQFTIFYDLPMKPGDKVIWSYGDRRGESIVQSADGTLLSVYRGGGEIYRANAPAPLLEASCG